MAGDPSYHRSQVVQAEVTHHVTVYMYASVCVYV